MFVKHEKNINFVQYDKDRHIHILVQYNIQCTCTIKNCFADICQTQMQIYYRYICISYINYGIFFEKLNQHRLPTIGSKFKILQVRLIYLGCETEITCSLYVSLHYIKQSHCIQIYNKLN